MYILKINKYNAIIWVMLTSLLGMEAKAQYYEELLENDQKIRCGIELNANEIMLGGVEASDMVSFDDLSAQKGFMLIFDKSAPKLKRIDLGLPFSPSSIETIDKYQDTLYILGVFKDSITNKRKLFWSKFTLDLSLLAVKTFSINTIGENYGIQTSFFNNGEHVLGIQDRSGNFFYATHFLKIDKDGELVHKTVRTNYAPNTPIFCTKICKGFIDSTYFVTFRNGSEEIHTLNKNFELDSILSLPLKDNASIGNDGYAYYQASSAKVIENKLYLALYFDEIKVGAASTRYNSLITLDSALNKLAVVSKTGKIGIRNFSAHSNFDNQNNKYLSGLDNFQGTFYPANGTTNTIQTIKIDDNDSIIWDYKFSNNNYLVPSRVIPASDSGCIVIGEAYKEGETDSRDPFVLIIDSKGQTTGIDSERKETSTIDIYPNPANNSFSVLLNEPHGEKIEIEIFNLQGQLQLKETLSNKERNKIDVSNFPSGLYLIRIVSGQYSIANQKLVITH